MRMHKALLFFLLLLGAACSMQQDIEVNLPAHTPIPFVECYLEPGVPARVLATQSVAFFEKLEVAPEDDLNVRLYRNGEEILLKDEYLVDSTHNNVFNYISSDTVHYDQTSQWELVVHKEEKEIARGEARFLPRPEIEKINYTLGADSLIALEIKIKDNPEEKNYYRVRIYAKDEFPGSGFNVLYTDEIARGGTLTVHTGLTLRTPNNGLVVSVYHLEESYYTFLRSLQKAFDANYNPFAQPANVESNLQGEAMGVFTAVSGVTELVYVDR